MSTNTSYLNGITIPDVEIVEINQTTNPPNNQDYELTCYPLFNYLAASFNEKYSDVTSAGVTYRKELYMPTPYSEVIQTPYIEDLYTNIDTGASWVTFAEDDEGNALYDDDGDQIVAEEVIITRSLNILQGGILDNADNASQVTPRGIFRYEASNSAQHTAKTLKTRKNEDTEPFKDIVISDSPIRTSAHSAAKHFPQYVKLNFSVHDRTNMTILSTLNDNNWLYHFIKDISYKFSLSSDDLAIESAEDGSNSFEYGNSLHPQEEFDDCISVINEATVGDFNPQGGMSVERYAEYVGTSNGIRTHLNSNDEVLQQIVCFEIKKFRSGSGSVYIQSFWTSCLSDSGNFEIYDTQILPQETYRYEVFAYSVKSTRQDSSGKWVSSVYRNKISEVVCKIEQPSLPRPQVWFKNLKNTKNKIRVFLNASAHPEKLPFMQIKDGETTAFYARKDLYDTSREKDNFVYEYDAGKYEIYRMTTHPFKNSSGEPYSGLAELCDSGYNPLTVNGQLGSTLGYHTDQLKPFKKYYYIFRAINHYGYPSNPSPIWEVELRQDADETFLYTNVVGFADPNIEKHMLTKTMMRLMQVVPSPFQTTLVTPTTQYDETTNITDDQGNQLLGYSNEAGEGGGDYIRTGYVDAQGDYMWDEGVTQQQISDSSPLDDTVTGISFIEDGVSSLNLGITDSKHSIWYEKSINNDTEEITTYGKRFKIRVVSKNTGRKIDLNLKFFLNRKT